MERLSLSLFGFTVEVLQSTFLLSYSMLTTIYVLPGFVAGDLDTDDIWLRVLCVELQIVIVNVEYRSVRLWQDSARIRVLGNH